MAVKKEVKRLRKATFLLDDELLVALKIQAAKERTSMSNIIARLVERYLKEKERRG